MIRIRTAAIAIAMLALIVPLAACTDTAPPEPDVEETLPDVAPPLTLDELPPYTGVVRLNAGSNCPGAWATSSRPGSARGRGKWCSPTPPPSTSTRC